MFYLGTELLYRHDTQSFSKGMHEQNERIKQSVTFHTVPSRFASSSFNYSQPYARLFEIDYGTDSQVLKGFRERDKDSTPFSFTLPGQLITRLKTYIANYYLYESEDPNRQTRGKNCYQFAAHMGNIPVYNNLQAARELNQRTEPDPVDAGDILPGTLLAIAHPQMYKDYGGIRIDHVLMSLDKTMGIQVMGIGGPFGITTYDYIIDEDCQIMLSASPDIWQDRQPPRPEEFQLHRVRTNDE